MREYKKVEGELTKEIVLGLEEEIVRNLRKILMRPNISELEYSVLTAMSRRSLESLDFFSPDDYEQFARMYNSAQIRVMGADELSSENGLKRLILGENARDLSVKDNRLSILSSLVGEIYVMVAEGLKKESRKIDGNDEKYLKIVQAAHIVNPHIAEGFADLYNQLVKNWFMKGKVKKIVSLPIRVGYGLIVE
jgi:hypothetical protein